MTDINLHNGDNASFSATEHSQSGEKLTSNGDRTEVTPQNVETADIPETLNAENVSINTGNSGSSSNSSDTINDDLNSGSSDLRRVPTNKSLLYKCPDQRPPIFKSTFQECICVACVTFAPAAATMAASCFQLGLTTTSDFFHVDGGRLTWCVNSVVLANGACLLLMGGVADALGRRNSLMIGYFTYAIFSLISGFMNNFVVLCIMRALMGASVACATPAAAGFLGSTYKDSKRKNMALSIFSLGAPVGGASGFFIAGVCLTALNWRAIHYFLAIFFCVLTICVYFYLPDDETHLEWKRSKTILRHLDYGGSIISLAAFTLICFALTQVDATEKKWRTPYIIALLIVGILLIGVFVLYEIYIPSQPIMPMKLYKSLNFDLCMIISAFSWMNFQGSLNYYSIIYFEDIRKYSSIITACCMLPQPIVGMCVNIFAGLTMHLIPGHILVSVGCLGFLVATIIWSTMSIDRNYFLGPFWSFCVCVLGADLIYNVSNRCSLNLVSKDVQSRAAGTFNTIINLASSVGLGISSTIVTAKYSLYGTTEEEKYPEQLWAGIRYAFYFGIALCGASLVISFFLKVGVIGAVKKMDDIEEDQDQSSSNEKISEPSSESNGAVGTQEDDVIPAAQNTVKS